MEYVKSVHIQPLGLEMKVRRVIGDFLLVLYRTRNKKNIRNVTLTQEWPKRKSRQTRWEWQLDFVSPHKLVMHSHDVASLYNYTFLCAWYI